MGVCRRGYRDVSWDDFIRGKCTRRGNRVESVMECWDGIRWRLGRFDRNWKEGDFCGDCCANCIAIWNITN